MRTTILLLAGTLVLLAGVALWLWRPLPAAGGRGTLAWDHDLAGVAYFKVTIDDRAPIVVRGRTEVALPADLGPGEHRAVVEACDEKNACSVSAPLVFRRD